jgi:hypothetical protein
MIAFEAAHGMSLANSGTAKLERTPTPPPKITNRMNAAMGPVVAAVAVSGLCTSNGFMRWAPLRIAGGLQRLRAVMSP